MNISLIRSFAEAGSRLFLLPAVFLLLLLATAAGHTDSGGFTSTGMPALHGECAGSGDGDAPDAVLQEDEFDDAVIPKPFYDFIPSVEPPEPFRFERPAFRTVHRAASPVAGRVCAFITAPPVRRC